MTSRGSRSTAIVHVGRLLALALAVVVSGKLGMMIAPVDGLVALVWPPTGISLAALLLCGDRLWPGITAGVLATSLWMGAPPLVALGIALGNTLEALAGA